MGISRSTFVVNKNGKITKTFYSVKPSGHSKEVRELFATHTASNDLKSNIRCGRWDLNPRTPEG